MDIYDYLKKDHQKVDNLFKEMLADIDSAKRLEVFKTIKSELVLHAESEQATFYAALNKTDKSKEEAQHAVKEHKDIKSAISKIDKLSPGSAAWLIELGSLKSLVTHHVKEEETEIFITAKKIISKQRAVELTEEMAQKKQEILKKLKSS